MKLGKVGVRSPLVKNCIYYFLLVFIALAVGYVSLGRGFRFSIYSGFGGDYLLGMETVKSIQENGLRGIYFNDRIGAPDVSSLIDFPAMGMLMGLLLWLITLFVKSTPAVMYVYLILSFALDGVSMSMLLRKLKIKKEISFIISLLFAFAPYHFYRYLGHSSLISYMSVPIAIYLCLYIIDIVEEDKIWKLAVCSVLLGLEYGYYYAFGLIMMALAYIVRLVRTKDIKGTFRKLWLVGVVLFTVLLSLMPGIVYSALHGANEIAGKRSPIEQEIYGLKIINLLLPVTYSRNEFLLKFTNKYLNSGAPLQTENVTAGLGIVAGIGFLCLCAAFIISFSKKDLNSKKWKTVDFLSLCVLTFLLAGAIGGFGEIFAWFVTAQIRCYNRSSIFITGLSLVMVAMLLDYIGSRHARASFALCAVVLVVGLYDQVGINHVAYPELADVQKGYETYFSQVENNLGNEAMVYQLPFFPFPEYSAKDYRHFKGYLFTDTIRWSYGGVKGRNVSAEKLHIDSGMSYEFLAGIQNAGFKAVYVDTDLYDNQGTAVLEFYDSLNISPMISSDGKLYTYDISNLVVPEEYLIKGWSHIRLIANMYGNAVPDDVVTEIANGLPLLDDDAVSKLYQIISENEKIKNYSDAQYIDFLYTDILGRTTIESNEERNDWLARVDGGMTRKELLLQFLSSQEFRTLVRINE